MDVASHAASMVIACVAILAILAMMVVVVVLLICDAVGQAIARRRPSPQEESR